MNFGVIQWSQRGGSGESANGLVEAGAQVRKSQVYGDQDPTLAKVFIAHQS